MSNGWQVCILLRHTSGLAISADPREKMEISVEKNAPEEIAFFHLYWKKWKKLKIGVMYLFLHLDLIPERKLSLIPKFA